MIPSDQNYFSIDHSLSWKEIADKIKNTPVQKPTTVDDFENHIDDYHQELAQLASQQEHGQLALDIYQTPADIIVEAPISGVKPENLDISIHDDVLTIKGTRHRSNKVKTQDIIYQECHWGNFSRSIVLPIDVVNDRIDATLTDGILTIRLPKAKQSRNIKVRVN